MSDIKDTDDNEKEFVLRKKDYVLIGIGFVWVLSIQIFDYFDMFKYKSVLLFVILTGLLIGIKGLGVIYKTFICFFNKD